MGRVIELKWTCSDCGAKDILGRHKRCPSCGSPREKGEMQMNGLKSGSSGHNPAKSVTDPELLKLAKAGADWFCTHCGSGNIGNGDRCSACAAPRYGEAAEDHPDFLGMHREHAREAMNIAKLTGPPEIPPRDEEDDIQREVEQKLIPVQKLLSDTVNNYGDRENTRQKKRLLGAIIVSVVLGLIVTFFIWAFQTHEATGSVSSMTWSHETVLQHWTTFIKGEWEKSAFERRETPPVNGSGEQAGMEKVIGSCYEKHYEDERYVCGSHEECSPKYRSESYECGETCSDNGNGFATCSPRYCSRSVPDGETCRSVNDYCSRPIYKTWCDYRTQEWRTTQTAPVSGIGRKTSWASVEQGSLDRTRYTVKYKLLLAYQDRGKSLTTEYAPVKGVNGLLGPSLLTEKEAKAAERDYLTWDVGDEVTLEINNLGGLHDVRRGVLPAER
jgi:hypothetical protein